MSTRIKVMDDGPLMVTGDFHIVDMEDVRFKFKELQPIALCRCGKSSGQPFCDGSHTTYDFKSRPRA